MFVLVAIEADVEPAAILLLLVLVARLSRSAQTVSRSSLQLANLLPAVGDVRRLTGTAQANAEHLEEFEGVSGTAGEARGPAFHPPRPGEPLVELRDVSYTYPGSDRGLRAVTVNVPAGLVTAVTGRSGAGKSTLVDVVLGLLRPSSGDVRVAGTIMEASLLPWWRQRVAYVPQETVLFPGSVRENLAWSARGEIDDDAIWSALRRAAADFAVDLPDGLDTMLGDRGVRLSGGERQRMAIARALLRDPALLVLDEATSALDDETEAEVLATLRNLVPAVTVLVVAHRRSTLEAADQVIRVEDGSVAD
jgi:ATP-binding cassette subfamily C protein